MTVIFSFTVKLISSKTLMQTSCRTVTTQPNYYKSYRKVAS